MPGRFELPGLIQLLNGLRQAIIESRLQQQPAPLVEWIGLIAQRPGDAQNHVQVRLGQDAMSGGQFAISLQISIDQGRLIDTEAASPLQRSDTLI